MPNEDTDGGDDRNLDRLEVHCAYTGAFRGIYPDDVSTKLAQFSAAPTIPLILKGEEMVDAVGIEPTTSRLRVECSQYTNCLYFH